MTKTQNRISKVSARNIFCSEVSATIFGSVQKLALAEIFIQIFKESPQEISPHDFSASPHVQKDILQRIFIINNILKFFTR